jgi:anti-sigma factor RsiW
MTACQRFAPMIGAREGGLAPAEVQALAAHLDTCHACQAFAADVAATSGLFAEALLRRASTRDFAPFVDEVMARTGHVRQVRPGRSGARGSPWFQRRWRALAVLAVPVLAAAALFMYVRWDRHQEKEQPQLAALEIDAEGGIGTVLQTQDGPVVLLQPDDESGS